MNSIFVVQKFEYRNFFNAGTMSFNGLKLEYALEGISNFCAWKYRMEPMLDGTGLLEYIKTYIPKPIKPYAQQLAHWKKDTKKYKRIILEGVKDHVVSNFHGKETNFAMWKVIKDIFQSNNDSKKLTLRDKLRNIQMGKNEIVVQYLSRFTHIRY